MSVNVDRSLRLPESEYFAEPQAKSGIALHHTVCDDAHTTVRLWRADRTAGGTLRRVATAYAIDRDGTVFELFDPAGWAFHSGLPWPYRPRVAFEQRFIGIEITSQGGLTEHDGRLYACDQVAPVFETPAAEGYRAGSQAAHAGCRDLSARYVAELGRPTITLGSSISQIAAAGAGFLRAGAIHEYPRP